MHNQPLHSHGDFLSAGVPGDDGNMTINDEREEETDHRPLQLPRVGWGTDDDEDDAHHAPNPNDAQMQSTPDTHRDDGSIGSQSAMSKSMSCKSELELASIPEDISMHGAWPDDYPDILGCYNYDYDRRRQNRCGPKLTRRLCAVVIIVFAAVVGSEVSSKASGKRRQRPQPVSPDSDIDANPANLEKVGGAKNHTPVKNQYPSDVDMYKYESINDTLQPIMYDDSAQWDGSFFHAFEFCGMVYERIPCPYVAYCPLGPGYAPLGGAKIESTGSWAPVFFNSMGRNDPQHPDWVQLGSDGTCQLYSQLYGRRPPWDLTSGGGFGDSKTISLHVMCCLEPVDGTYRGQEDSMPNDPYFLHRPPSLEEDELEKPIPIREEEEGKRGEEPNNSDGNRILRSDALELRKSTHHDRSGELVRH